VLDLLLEPVTVALPSGSGFPVEPELWACLEAILGQATLRAMIGNRAAQQRRTDERVLRSPNHEHGLDRPARLARHDWRGAVVDLSGYAASGLPAETMGRGLGEDPLFFAAALAGGSVLAGLSEPGPPACAGGADGSSPAARSPGEPDDVPVSDASSPPQASRGARGEPRVPRVRSEGALLTEAKLEG
jgi:hypothetical protein